MHDVLDIFTPLRSGDINYCPDTGHGVGEGHLKGARMGLMEVGHPVFGYTCRTAQECCNLLA
jgi:protein tyrosine phosphatase (PTP) superfamily phosphohydrolase (DUF442 family)